MLLLMKKCLAMAFLAALGLLTLPARAQNPIRIRGRVLNENGQPVSTASVVVKGTSNGVACDSSGNFVITAPANGTLVVSSVGFLPGEIPVHGRTNLSVSLSLKAGDVNEVVVIG